MRITDEKVIGKFTQEFDKMFVFSKAIQGKLVQNKCMECNDKVDDPFEHFQIQYLTGHINEVIIKKRFDSFYDEKSIIVTHDDDNNSFNISSRILPMYRAICLKNKKGSKWTECYKCKEKGIFENMPIVGRRVANRVKKEGKPNWHKFDEHPIFEEHPFKSACLECLHSIIVDESKLKSPNANKKIPFIHPSFSEDLSE